MKPLLPAELEVIVNQSRGCGGPEFEKWQKDRRRFFFFGDGEVQSVDRIRGVNRHVIYGNPTRFTGCRATRRQNATSCGGEQE